jgi:L-fuconolactonase
MHVCGLSKQEPLSELDIMSSMLPWALTVYEYFGDERMMFESNFPMDKASFSYISYWNAAMNIVALLTQQASSRRKLLHDNANRLYKLGLPAPEETLYVYASRGPSSL